MDDRAQAEADWVAVGTDEMEGKVSDEQLAEIATDTYVDACSHGQPGFLAVVRAIRDQLGRRPIARLREAERKRDKARKENDFMRNLLASSNLDYVYCGLSKADMVKCASGFPGCGRADDLVFDGEVGDTEVANGGGVENEATNDHR